MNADEGLRRIGIVVSIGLGVFMFIGLIIAFVQGGTGDTPLIWIVLVILVGGVGGFVVPWVFFSLLRWIIRGFRGKEK